MILQIPVVVFQTLLARQIAPDSSRRASIAARPGPSVRRTSAAAGGQSAGDGQILAHSTPATAFSAVCMLLEAGTYSCSPSWPGRDTPLANEASAPALFILPGAPATQFAFHRPGG